MCSDEVADLILGHPISTTKPSHFVRCVLCVRGTWCVCACAYDLWCVCVRVCVICGPCKA